MVRGETKCEVRGVRSAGCGVRGAEGGVRRAGCGGRGAEGGVARRSPSPRGMFMKRQRAEPERGATANPGTLAPWHP